MSSYGKPTVVVPNATVVTSSPVVREVQVNKPTNIPLDPIYGVSGTRLLSLDYKIEDISGQCVKDWFKNDFGANGTFEFQAKVKGAAGRSKAKIIVDPTDKNSLRVTEDLEFQAKIHSDIQTLMKIRPKELSAQFDFGFRPVAGNWFNPFVVFRLPRTGGIARTAGTFGVGGVFHFDSFFNRRARYQVELGLGFGAEGGKNETVLRQNFSLWYKNFILGLYESWNFTQGFSHESKLSAGYSEGPARAYAQLDLTNDFRVSNLGFGASYKVRPDVKLFLQTQQVLGVTQKDGKTSTPFNFAGVDIGTGVELTHAPSGVGVKLGYFHEKKIATVLSFGLNRYFTGSILFDVDLGLTFRNSSVPPLPSKTSPTELP